MFRDLNKINGLSVFTLNLRPGVIIYQLVMSHLYTDYMSVGGAGQGSLLISRTPGQTNTKEYLTLRRPGIDGLQVSQSPHFIRLLIIKTVFCPNLKFRQLWAWLFPRPGSRRSWPQVTRFVTIVTMSWNSVTQRDTGDWSLNSVTDLCVIWREITVKHPWSDFNSPPLVGIRVLFSLATSPKMSCIWLKKESVL